MIFNRLKLAVDRVIAAFSVAVMLALVVCVVWQVFSRYVLSCIYRRRAETSLYRFICSRPE